MFFTSEFGTSMNKSVIRKMAQFCPIPSQAP